MFPPLPGMISEGFVDEGHWIGDGFKTPTVVLGPAGTGLTTFKLWIKKRAELAGTELVEIDFSRFSHAREPARQRDMLASAWFGNGQPIQGADLAGLLDEYLLSRGLGAPTTRHRRSLIFQRLEELHQDNKEILLGRLRDLVEQRALGGTRFVVLAHETAPLEDIGPFSSFMQVCDVYRLADWTKDDVVSMWCTWVPDHADKASRVAEECIEWTGGQPILASLFLGYLFERRDRIDKGQMWSEVSSWLIEHPPPNALKHWQRELARILDRSALLRRKFSRFLPGERQRHVAREELPLFLAGWIGQDEKGRWGIRSRAHTRWGEGPFRTPERYNSRSGGGRR